MDSPLTMSAEDERYLRSYSTRMWEEACKLFAELDATRLALAASQATARAAREAAQSLVHEFEDNELPWPARDNLRTLLAAPADESALRAVCERVAQAAFDLGIESTKGINLVSKDELLDRVLGPSGKETT